MDTASAASLAGSDAQSPHTNPTGFYKFSVGSLRAVALSEGYCGVIDSGTGPPPIAADRDPSEVQDLLARHGRAQDAPAINLTALAVQGAGPTVLIDSGFGAFATPDGENRPGMVAPNLEAAGITPDAVELVIVSHPHGDHIGGLLRPEGGLTYPNARYVMPRREWQFWMESEPDLSSALIPDGFRQGMRHQARTALPQIEHALDLADPGEEVAPGIRLVAMPGHTHGMVGVELTSGETRLLYVADAFMHPVVSIKRPHWRVAMDLDAEAATRTRGDLLERCARGGELVLAPHFPWPALGRIVDRGGEHEWVAADWRWWP
ncbi:MAG TPA: MBL fold metallo-hydrolase [Solirubrobacteraceae bacterium]|jgi:glyoxylase-like metal-dependent hydrolase (beta-lactamase superfamily II)